MMDHGREAMLAVLKGPCTEDDLPAHHSRTVRVYISATNDMHEERDAVLRAVYPEVKQYCCSRYGIDFQFVEMHWGVAESTGYRHGDLSVIRGEIRLCQQMSLGPNLLCLVGHKYGPSFLPEEMTPSQYEILREELSSRDDKMASLMARLYTIDESRTPPVFAFRKISVDTVEGVHHDTVEGLHQDTVEGLHQDTVEGLHQDTVEFRKSLQESVQAAHAAGKLTKDDVTSLVKSAFETEVLAGVRDAQEVAKDKVICFIRLIRDLDVHHEDRHYGHFVDTVTSGIKDQNAENRLLQIRDLDLHHWLPTSNIKVIKTGWDLISVTLNRDSQQVVKAAQRLRRGTKLTWTRHDEYLDEFCSKVLSQLKRLIDRVAAPMALQQKGPLEEASAEVTKHWRKAYTIRDTGQDSSVVSSLHKYLKGHIGFPSVLHGGSSDVRAAIIARLSTSLTNSADKTRSTNPSIVLRFLSPTDTTANLLVSLARQITLAYDRPWTEPVNKCEATERFQKCLELATENWPVYILIADTDMLMGDLDLSWIPENLPQHVKMIFSCSSTSDTFTALCAKTPYEDCILDAGVMERPQGEVSSLSASEIHTTLRESKKPLTHSQDVCLHDLIAHGHGTVPDEIQDVDEYSMNQDGGRGQLVAWLQHLEDRHGGLLVSSCLRYITAGMHGVTECELLDLLSLDKELLKDGVFLGTQPPLHRLPGLLWARLRADLDPYLTTRDLDDRDVICWAHQEFSKCVISQYMDRINPASKTHAHMALYFMNMVVKQKPIDDSKSRESNKIANTTEPEIRADPHPDVYDNRDPAYTEVRYNKRKISELPYQLFNAGQCEDLKKHVLFSYKWLYNKLMANSVSGLISTLEGLQQTYQLREDMELSEVIGALQESVPAISVHPNCLRTELTGRLLSFLGNMPRVTSLIRECDDEGYRHCVLTPLTSSFDEGQDEIVQVIQCDMGYTGELYVTSLTESDELIVYTVPEKLSLWDANSAEKIRNFECSQYTYTTDIRVTQDGRRLLAFNNGHPKYAFLEDSPLLDIYDIETGQKIHRIYFGESDQKPKKLFRVFGLNERRIMFDTPNYVAVCIDMVRLCDIKKGKEISMVSWPFLVTPDERYLVVTERNGHVLVVRSFPELTHRARLTSPKNITAVVALVTETTLNVLVAAGSVGALCLYDFNQMEEGVRTLAPVKQGALVEKKDLGLKGGCVKLIASPDNVVVLAVYIYLSGKNFQRTNFLTSTESLANIHIYESGVEDVIQFSPDSKYILHLKVAVGEFDLMDSRSGVTIASYGENRTIRDIVFGADPLKLFVTTREGIEILDITRVIKKGKAFDTESDSDSVSVELNLPAKKLKTIMADIEWNDLMRLHAVETIPINLTQVDEDNGLVSSNSFILKQGIHFSQSELPVYLGDVIITPDGNRLILVFEQVPVLGSPLNEEGNYSNHHSRGGRLGSEVDSFQRRTSVIRVFNTAKGDCVQKISIRNERIMACTEKVIVTSPLGGRFTNIYSISSAALLSTLECTPAKVTFSVDVNFLILIPQKHPNMIHIHSGPTYLDLRKCNLSDKNLDVWEIITCSKIPNQVLVSMLREQRAFRGQDQAGVTYTWIDLTQGVVTNTFSCNSELIHVLPDGSTGIDCEFNFYSLTTGQVLFRVLTADDLSLTEHGSFVTHDGTMVVFLDSDKGKVNVIDIKNKKIICQCFYHPSKSMLHSIQGHREVATLLPINGGFQMAIVDGQSIKQFAIQNANKQMIGMGLVKLRKTAYQGVDSRAEYFHAVNTNEDLGIVRVVNRKKHRASVKNLFHGGGRRREVELDPPNSRAYNSRAYNSRAYNSRAYNK